MNDWMNDPEWYRIHFRDLQHKQRFCADYWRLTAEFSTVQQALSSKRAKALRFVLYAVYVVQRERKTPWPELETVLPEYSFPRTLYATYCSQLFHTGRLSLDDLTNSLIRVGANVEDYSEPVSEHWTRMFELELEVLGRDPIE